MKVAASAARLTPRQLEKTISTTYGLDNTRIKAMLKNLVAQGELEYTYEFGSTYLVPSFNKPVRLSDHVVVKPPGHRFQAATDDVVLSIQPGAAFGGGRHATTRLAVKGIEFLLKEVRPEWLGQNCSVLDIGTGSGLLAMTAVCLGVKNGLGIDIDPSALAEAKENLVLNHLQERLVISDRRIDSLDQVFAIVLANLRYPTLKKLFPQILKLTDSGGGVVLSGFRPHERADLMELYTARYFKSIWTADENDWAAAVLKKSQAV